MVFSCNLGQGLGLRNSQDNEGVDTATTGWGSRKPTPEERLEKVEEDVERIDKDVTILKNIFNIMD